MNAIVEQLLAGEGRAAGQAAIILEAAGWAAASLAKLQRADLAVIERALAKIDGHPEAILSALAARNAVVVAFTPGAPAAAIKTARALAAAAEPAGAPACTIQVLESVPPALANHLATNQGGDTAAISGALLLRIAAAPAATKTPPVLGRTAPISLGKLQEGA